MVMEQTAAHENPYAAPVAAVVVEEAPRELELADRLTRLGAVFADGIFFGLSLVPMLSVLALQSNKIPGHMDAVLVIGLVVSVLALLGVAGANCYYLHANGQTLAKKLLGIRVVRRDGSHCGLARIFFARNLPVTVLGAIPFDGSLVSLVDALLIFRDDRRCLHDEIADTIVVKA
jgi:uncharacterized RDD family membrane protein YckC